MTANLPMRRKFLRHLGGVSGALGIVAGALLAYEGTRAYGVACSVVAVAIFAWHVVRDVKYSRVTERELLRLASEIANASSVEPVLMGLAGTLGLESPWRISMYEVQDSEWHLVARRSPIPEYEAPGRVSFPADEGCIGWALKSPGLTDELPSVPDRDTNMSGYTSLHISRRLHQDDIRRLRMPSRSYGAIVHHIPYGAYQGARVGIVVETTKDQGVAMTSVKRLLTAEMVCMLHQLSRIGPDAETLRSQAQAER